MSDQSQGAGWWQASNDLWYPPEQHPDCVAPAAPPPPPPPMQAPRVPPVPPLNIPSDPRTQQAVAKAQWKASRPWWKKKRFWLSGVLIVCFGGCAAIVAGTANELDKDTDNNNIPDVFDNANRDSEDMSLSEFGQIENGMTYQQVVAIVGSAGNLTSSAGDGQFATQLYSWDGNGSIGANANVTFQDGEVVAKAQFGLADP